MRRCRISAVDPIVAAAQVVNGLQTIASRNTHPLESAVVSITQIHGGDTWNVIPETVVLRGTTRSFGPAVRDRMEPAIRRIAEGAWPRSVPRWNYATSGAIRPRRTAAAETEIAAAAAAAMVGEDNVQARSCCRAWGPRISRCFLEKKPGAYIWIGNGDSQDRRHAAQPALRFQRRDLAARRQLLGAAR